MARRAPALGATLARDGDTTEDERLLVAAAQRDPSRFADLYDHNFDRVYAFVARRVPQRQEVQDLTSEVFQRALAGLDRFEPRGGPFAGWLLQIAAQAIADRSASAAGERSLPNANGVEQPSFVEVEDYARLFRLVGKLPDDQRRVVVMRFAEGKGIREIAATIGRSEGTVKQLQLRGLQNLQARLSDTHG